MKLEKLFTVFMLLILALTIAPMALAEDAVVTSLVVTDAVVTNAVVTNAVVTNAVVTNAVVTSIDLVNDEEIEIMSTPHGAEVRLLQLEASLERNILSGEDVVLRILEKDVEFDASVLNGIINELKALVTEVQSADLEGSADELAHSFVEVKADAIELSKEFRSEVTSLNKLSSEDKAQLRIQAKEKFGERINSAKEKLTRARNNFNAIQAKKLMRSLGSEDSFFVDKVISGEMTLDQVKEKVRFAYMESSDEAKAQLRTELKELNMKRHVFRQSSMENSEEMIQNRLQLRDSMMLNLRANSDGSLGDGSGAMTGRPYDHIGAFNSDGEE